MVSIDKALPEGREINTEKKDDRGDKKEGRKAGMRGKGRHWGEMSAGPMRKNEWGKFRKKQLETKRGEFRVEKTGKLKRESNTKEGQGFN